MVFAKKWEITVEDGFKLREGIGDMYPGFAKDAKAEGFKEIY
jgi:hypothetical protein